MFLAPILPSLAILNATGEILNKIAARLARSTDIAGSARPADVAGPITWSTWSANVSWSITRSARPADVSRAITWRARSANITWPVARLSWPTDVTWPTAAWLSGATKIWSTWTCGQRRCDVACAGTTCAGTTSGTRQLAGTVTQELGSCTTGQRATGQAGTKAWA
jgi:hypothetical protein